MDISKIPKQFCENITIGFSPEHFAMVMHVGEQGMAYALTPEHTKRLAQYLAHQVALYEKEYKEIHTEWSPGIKSPITMSDLKNPPGNTTSGGKNKKKK